MNNLRSFFAIVVITVAMSTMFGCNGAGGGGSSSTEGATAEGNLYYHFICNGDSQCLATNFAGAPSGTSAQGPGAGGIAGCNGLMNFGRINWSPPAQQWCDYSSGLTPPAPTLNSITVTPANKTLAKGLTQQYTATGNYSNGTSKDITGQVTWSANCGGVLCTPSPPASINSSGRATTLVTGNITIYATLGSVRGQTTLQVTAASLISITVTPANSTLNQYSTQQFTATGHFSDGSSAVLSSANWSSGTLATATINSSSGMALAIAAGTSTITATVGAISGHTLLTVSAVSLNSIAVTPTDPSLAIGYTRQLTATGTYSDATVRNITSQVTWSSADPAYATISNSGLVTGVSLGSSVMSASLAGQTGSTNVTVTAALLTSIVVTPATPTVATGLTKQFIATGTYSDSSVQDISTQVTWTSATQAAATVSSTGLATGVAAGTSIIGASLSSIAGSTTLTVVTLGSAWTPVTSGAGGGSGTALSLMGITWTGTQFVAVGAGAYPTESIILTSPDGLTWTERSSGIYATLNAVTWTGTQLVAVGEAPFGSPAVILTSPDGITWTLRNSGSTYALNAVTWTGSKLVAVGANETKLSSTNGITWTALGSLNYGNSFACIAWSGSIYIGCNGRIVTSSDASTWTSVTTNTPNAILWTGAEFILVGNTGSLYVTIDGSTLEGPYSGTNTTLRAIASTGTQLAAVGDAGTVVTAPLTAPYLTTNGSQWTVRSSGTSSNLKGIAWSGTRFVAVGDGGVILFTSP